MIVYFFDVETNIHNCNHLFLFPACNYKDNLVNIGFWRLRKSWETT